MTQRENLGRDTNEKFKRLDRVIAGAGFPFQGVTKLDPEQGDCPECGRKDIEVSVYRLSDGTIKKYIKCPDCIAKHDAEREAKEKTERSADMPKRRRIARMGTGIPPRFMAKDFSNFDKGRSKEIDAAFDMCYQYAEEYPIGKSAEGYRSLYIYSEKSWGVGKTHLSCAIAHRILNRWQDVDTACPRVRWVSEPHLFSKIEASFNYTWEDKQTMPNKEDIINDLIHADLLILDDVGKEKRQDPRFVQRTLFAIINGRYDRDYPIVFTANLKPTLLKAHLGTGGMDEASYDRLLEMCHGKSIPIDGDSYRRE